MPVCAETLRQEGSQLRAEAIETRDQLAGLQETLAQVNEEKDATSKELASCRDELSKATGVLDHMAGRLRARARECARFVQPRLRQQLRRNVRVQPTAATVAHALPCPPGPGCTCGQARAGLMSAAAPCVLPQALPPM